MVSMDQNKSKLENKKLIYNEKKSICGSRLT